MRILLAGLLSVFSIWMNAGAQPSFSGRIDTLVNSYVGQGLFSGSVLVGRDGEVFSQGYGLANRSWDIPNTGETRFQITSLTKPFTAMLILQLAEGGTLSLDDPLFMYLPDYPADYGGDVRIHHLLNHTSGIPNYTDFPSWSDTTSRIDVRPADFVEQIAAKKLDFEPGTDFGYSNSNYYLLGIIIERVTGMSYSRVLQDRILTPTGLSDTGYLFNRLVVDRMAEGYERLSSGLYEKAPYQSPSTAYSAAGMYSDVNDLYSLTQQLFVDGLLTEESRIQMMTPQEGNYGYGWVIGEVYADEAASFFKAPFSFKSSPREGDSRYRMIWHRGSNPGFNTLLASVPDQRWTVILLENQHLAGDSEGTRIYDMAGEIFELLNENEE